MDPGPQHQRTQAIHAAAQRLKRAATLAELHAKKPLYQKRTGRRTNAEIHRLDWPGVMKIFDANTGKLLARSLPGQPGQLDPAFDPIASD